VVDRDEIIRRLQELPAGARVKFDSPGGYRYEIRDSDPESLGDDCYLFELEES
jgi:hypothetical protein